MTPEEARNHLLLDEVASAHRARADEVVNLKVDNLLLRQQVSDLMDKISELESDQGSGEDRA